MKVNTDGVLLGAWSTSKNARKVLDIGTGCGVIALMLCQGSDSIQVAGIEIHKESVLQARYNVANSPYKTQIKIELGDFTKFDFGDQRFDLIISNPPFFTAGSLPSSDKKQISKHQTSLTIESLIKKSTSLLSDQGKINIVVPFHQLNQVKESVAQNGLSIHHRTDVKSFADSDPFNVMLELGFINNVSMHHDSLVIYAARNQYTLQYIELVKPYYLHM